jgi:queuine tRNA-ribosyltransferase
MGMPSFKKVLTLSTDISKEQAITKKGNRHAWVHEDGVVFKSHLNGERHQFTPEISMQIQHSIGADICFAFDELTSLMDSYEYQVESLERTHRWAVRSLQEMRRLRALNPDKNYQALFGVLQGAHYEDLRKQAATFMASQDFDGYGIGGALEKKNMAKIIRWVNEILPENKPRHLLGISEPEDIFGAIEQGIDTFDCVSPTRIARNGTVYTATGKINVRNAQYKNRFEPIDNNCPCYTCQNYTLAYLCHLLRAKETLAGTLLSIHNEYFIIHLVDSIRESIEDGSFFEFRSKFLSKYSK